MLLAVAALEWDDRRGGEGGGIEAAAAAGAVAAATFCHNTKTWWSIYNSLFMLSGNTLAGKGKFQTKYSFEV